MYEKIEFFVDTFVIPSNKVFLQFPFFHAVQIGDLGLAVSSMTSRRDANVAGTRSHIPPEALIATSSEPDELWDIYT